MVKKDIPPSPISVSDKEALQGHVKATREDWLNVAKDILVSDGVGEVKVLSISERLEVSRSSFYWYFKSRKDLLNALLILWEEQNTRTILEHCEMPASTITGALCNFFRCFVNPDLFDQGLDFAVREWSRREGSVRTRIDKADKTRVSSITNMYLRFGFEQIDADARARIVYFMQLGYHALDQTESLEERMSRLDAYLFGFTGLRARSEETEAFKAYAKRVSSSTL
jgi:AcrR family transcriptional regulator